MWHHTARRAQGAPGLLVCCLLAILALAHEASAQVSPESPSRAPVVTGRVQDSTGRPLPNESRCGRQPEAGLRVRARERARLRASTGMGGVRLEPTDLRVCTPLPRLSIQSPT